ncbi:MAG: hypothetical protein ACRD1R_11755 [Acidobacteriota bacterium]
MTEREITTAALKAAWKMVETIFPRYSVSRKDGSALLTLTIIMALQDLRESEVLEWKKPPPPNTLLILDQDSIRPKKAEKSRFVLKADYSSQEIDRAAQSAEQLCDRYDLPEIERATLFTALPCLGLHALQDYIVWKKEPPFLELG